MKSTPINLQDVFLNQVRKDKTAITVYLMNGFQIRGQVMGFDNYIVVIDSEGKQQVVYKHAISTIMPIKPVNFIVAENEQSEE